MITTTANRVQRAGFWCDDATRQTQEALDKIGATWDTEIPVKDGLRLLGLSNTLLALGAPHPRYAIRSGLVLLKYCDYLWDKLSKLAGTDLHLEKLVYKSHQHSSLREERIERWSKEKFATGDPVRSLLCSAILVMLSSEPLHIRAIHAGKDLFSALVYKNGVETKPHEEAARKLQELLDADSKVPTAKTDI